jgi:hypothetical protein
MIYCQFTFGLNTGLTYNGLTGDVPEDASYKKKLGFTGGVHAEYNLSDDIILGLGARYYGTGTVVTYDVGEKETVDSFKISVSYISFPVVFKVLTGGKHTYFSSGFDYKILLEADLKYLISSLPDKSVKDRLQSYEASVFAGFGGTVSFGRPSLSLELRYSHSLNNLSKDNFSTVSGLPARFRFSGFQLLLFMNYSTK